MRRLSFVLLVMSVLGALTGIIGVARADAGHVLTIDDVTVTEGNGNLPGLAIVTVHVSPAPDALETVKVDFGTSAQAAQGATATTGAPGDPTPSFPEDFAQTDGTLIFAVAETSKTITVPVVGDNADEGDETFFVKLFNARGECLVPDTCSTGASIGDDRATVTITDNDDAPMIAIDDVTHDEGDESTTTYTFTVTKTGGSAQSVAVDYATADGTATAGSDYDAADGTLTFPASSPTEPETQTIDVTVNGDTDFEPSELFTVGIEATNATVGDASGVGTISNDDDPPPPSMSVGAASADEGNNVNFTVTLSAPPGPGQTATVDWATQSSEGEGNASEGVDYPAASGSLVFTAGESEQTISVATTEDDIDEADESFAVKLTKPAVHGSGGYTYNVAGDLASGTIVDDDAAPALSVDDVVVEAEGASETSTAATFTVTKTGKTDRSVTVNVATVDDLATSPADYTAVETVLSFAPEETSKEITVDVLGDNLDETDETFVVQLSDPTNATVADAEGVGTITDDDDATATLAIGDVKVTEGTGGAIAAVLTVTKSGETGRSVTVRYSTANGSAWKDLDYTPAAGELLFDADETTKTISVDVLGDKLDETTEVFYVNIFGAANASITDGKGEVKVLDNDVKPALSISDGSVKELSNNSCNLTVKLSAVSGRSVTVHYATANGTAGSSDYLAKSGDLTFAPGESSKVVKVYAKADSSKEGTEKFSVKLSGVNPSDAASIADATGVCSIIDND